MSSTCSVCEKPAVIKCGDCKRVAYCSEKCGEPDLLKHECVYMLIGAPTKRGREGERPDECKDGNEPFTQYDYMDIPTEQLISVDGTCYKFAELYKWVMIMENRYNPLTRVPFSQATVDFIELSAQTNFPLRIDLKNMDDNNNTTGIIQTTSLTSGLRISSMIVSQLMLGRVQQDLSLFRQLQILATNTTHAYNFPNADIDGEIDFLARFDTKQVFEFLPEDTTAWVVEYSTDTDGEIGFVRGLGMDILALARERGLPTDVLETRHTILKMKIKDGPLEKIPNTGTTYAKSFYDYFTKYYKPPTKYNYFIGLYATCIADRGDVKGRYRKGVIFPLRDQHFEYRNVPDQIHVYVQEYYTPPMLSINFVLFGVGENPGPMPESIEVDIEKVLDASKINSKQGFRDFVATLRLPDFVPKENRENYIVQMEPKVYIGVDVPVLDEYKTLDRLSDIHIWKNFFRIVGKLVPRFNEFGGDPFTQERKSWVCLVEIYKNDTQLNMKINDDPPIDVLRGPGEPLYQAFLRYFRKYYAPPTQHDFFYAIQGKMILDNGKHIVESKPVRKREYPFGFPFDEKNFIFVTKKNPTSVSLRLRDYYTPPIVQIDYRYKEQSQIVEINIEDALNSFISNEGLELFAQTINVPDFVPKEDPVLYDATIKEKGIVNSGLKRTEYGIAKLNFAIMQFLMSFYGGFNMYAGNNFVDGKRAIWKLDVEIYKNKE